MDVHQFKEMGLIWPEVKGFKIGYERGIPYTAERYIPEGRIKRNLKVSEALIRIGYIKQYLLKDSPSEVRPLYEAARFLETCKEDISAYIAEKLPISEKVYPYVEEILRGNDYLRKLEEEAYRACM